jgi:hypothetical protein
MKHYSPTGRRNHGRPLKRLLDTWDRNGSTSGPTAWQIYDDDDNSAGRGFDSCAVETVCLPVVCTNVVPPGWTLKCSFCQQNAFLCFVWVSENSDIFLCSVYFLVFVAECVYCAVRTGSLNIVWFT